jgi:hypothetical protein
MASTAATLGWDIADGAEGTCEDVVAVGLIPVVVAWGAQGLPAAAAGALLVTTPGDRVGEGLG